MQPENRPNKKKRNKNWGVDNEDQQQVNKQIPVPVQAPIVSKQLRYKNITELSSKYSFNIQAILGSGFASTVYLGQRVDTHEMVCIKAIDLLTMGYSNQYRDLIHKEIEHLNQFNSDFIVRLYDVYQSNTFYYLVMELCPGGDLYKMLKMSPMNFPPHFISQIIRQIAHGLMEIHNKNIIHRDMKTENIFILRFPQAPNEKIQVKIGDLGFCISVDEIQKSKKLGKVLQNVGSPIYMSPEVFNTQEYSYSSDVYSLGIIWYQLYHKKAPWEALNETELLHKKLKQPVQIWREDIDSQTKEMISKCISNDPSQRPKCEQILKLFQKIGQKAQ